MTTRIASCFALFGLTSTLTGCGAILPFALLGSGGFGDLGATFDAIDAAFTELEQQIDATPFVEVRVVNNSDVTAEVHLISGIQGPEPSEFINADLGFFSFIGEFGFNIIEADRQTVLVAPGGTATGELRCGDMIGLSAVAPIDGGANPRDFRDFDHSFGSNDSIDLFVPTGTVSFGGIGTSNDGVRGRLVHHVVHRSGGRRVELHVTSPDRDR